MRLGFVTGSENKVTEVERTLGEGYDLVQLEADLPELQPPNGLDDLEGIIKPKLIEARKQHPEERLIMVEDTSFSVEALYGLPGPFIKYWLNAPSEHGNDSPKAGPDSIYYAASGMRSRGRELRATATVVIGLVIDSETHFFSGEVSGRLTKSGDNGWGFDRILVPDGYSQRMGDLDPEVKAQMSHRANAVKALKDFLDVRR